VIGNAPNPLGGASTNPERISSGILVGREPHEPTFTRNGKELWVTVRGEDRIAILTTEAAVKQAGGADARAVREYLPTVNGPAQVWFSADGGLAFVASQKVPKVDVFSVFVMRKVFAPKRLTTLDIESRDKAGFAVQKTTPDGRKTGFRTSRMRSRS
jgi:DNA-binding beta-propeller fold protein YncE